MEFERFGNRVALPSAALLRAWRAFKDYDSVEQLARAAAISARTLAEWETEGGRRTAYMSTVRKLAAHYQVEPRDLLRHPLTRTTGAGPVVEMIRQLLTARTQDAVEYVAFCKSRGQAVQVTPMLHRTRIEGLIRSRGLVDTPEELEARWGEFARLLPGVVARLGGETDALHQGGLKRLVLDVEEGGVFWSRISATTFLVVATVDEPSITSGQAHEFVRKLEQVVRDAVDGGRSTSLNRT